MRASLGIIVLISVFGLTACDQGDPELMNVQSTGEGPDEFGVLPVKPLEEPPNYAQLPTPTPGGSNITDPQPKADAIAALGGNPNRARAGGIPAADAAIVSHTSRFGRDAAIRQTLAAEDLEFRRRNRGLPLERAFNVNVYYKAYEPLTLDSYRELERFRRLGVRTPAAPPLPVEE
ncbi:DUF3035 domain-containing protein [Parasulfitobacter algicola]|uniref:DUF3035 domain-containing protein n=1 Tax=Parasulfitobacter algicola TaxID=2614809 RepID=A0ABX2IQ65_9RHOB|nr:DUF3035 domain-containing protein [Sulfitobacter algicola]NSX55007.1 DUF3035 domain-containing protein [Sulfitobacter algicola]